MEASGSGLSRERHLPRVFEQPAFGLAGTAAFFAAIYAGLLDPHPYWQTLLAAVGGLATSYVLAAVADRLRERREMRRRSA